MAPLELVALILAVSLAVVALCTWLFVVFYRFLDRERRRGEAFRGRPDDR